MLRFGCKVTWLKQRYKRKGAKGFVCCRNYSKYQLSKYFNLKIIFSITECHDKSQKTHKRDIGHPEEGPGFEEGVWPPIAACHDKIHSPEISAFPKGLGIEERVWPRSNKRGNGRKSLTVLKKGNVTIFTIQCLVTSLRLGYIFHFTLKACFKETCQELKTPLCQSIETEIMCGYEGLKN